MASWAGTVGFLEAFGSWQVDQAPENGPIPSTWRSQVRAKEDMKLGWQMGVDLETIKVGCVWYKYDQNTLHETLKN